MGTQTIPVGFYLPQPDSGLEMGGDRVCTCASRSTGIPNFGTLLQCAPRVSPVRSAGTLTTLRSGTLS
jgi:hypothetical protein